MLKPAWLLFSRFLISAGLVATSFAQKPELLYLENKTPTYQQVISFYQALDKKYETAKLLTYGMTDAGKPLQLFVISPEKNFAAAQLHKTHHAIVLINNGIHPGEPDGVDASMKLAAEILDDSLHLPDHVVICIVPAYNIEGMLNRGCCSRSNQNGPEEYGFRGNGQNLDLNRDFIKCEAANTKALEELFHEWDPDIFIDTHVSDGADYQYVVTLVSSQHNKLTPPLGNFMEEKVNPFLFADMKKNGFEMSPYVNTEKETPDEGITAFLETPRFSTGFAALFNSIGYMVETHMFKPFPERVKGTCAFLNAAIRFASTHTAEIESMRLQAKRNTASMKTFPLSWVSDTTVVRSLPFKGYAAKHKTSLVTGQQRLYYDRNEPYEKPVPFFPDYKVETSVNAPAAYLIPQAWNRVIERLKWNGVVMKKLDKDTVVAAEMYYIAGYNTAHVPYEGKYVHDQVRLRSEKQSMLFHEGDYLIEVNQPANRYIVETLEPNGPDSWFNWGFFDAVLQQKEWFSDYIFEEESVKILEKNPALKKELDNLKSTNPEFAADHWEQLGFIYSHSGDYEKSHNRYPVARLFRD